METSFNLHSQVVTLFHFVTEPQVLDGDLLLMLCYRGLHLCTCAYIVIDYQSIAVAQITFTFVVLTRKGFVNTLLDLGIGLISCARTSFYIKTLNFP